MLGSAGHKVSPEGQKVGQQVFYSTWNREQRAGKRVLAGLGKTKGNVLEFGVEGRGKINQGALRALRR